MSERTSRGPQGFWGPAAFLAGLLIVVPPADWVINVWPPHPGSLAWRYASAGLFSTTMLTVLLGLFLASVLAAARPRPRVLVALSAVNALVGAALAIVALDFAMNVVQLAASTTASTRTGFLLGSVKVFLKYIAVCWLSFWLARAAWKNRGRRPTAEASSHSLPLAAWKEPGARSMAPSVPIARDDPPLESD